MGNRIRLLFLIICLGFLSCKPLLWISGFYKAPRYEDFKSVKKFASNAKYHSLLVTRSLKGYEFFIDSLSHGYLHVFIFNRDKQLLLNNSECQWANVRLLDSLETTRNFKIDTTVTVKKLAAILESINGLAMDDKQMKEYDYFIFYSWVKWSPRLSRKMIQDVNNFGFKTDKNIFVASVNLDYQKSWPDNDWQKEKIITNVTIGR